MCNKCKCSHDIIYGPGDDDYGRDNFEEDWECPACHKKSKFTRRSIRMGIDRCPKCEWLSEHGKMMNAMIDRISKIHGDKNGKNK